MKGLIIHGSPRRANTWNVLSLVKEELAQIKNLDWNVIELGKEKIPNCIGCFNCIFKGENTCPHKEQMKSIIEKIEEADFLIITSPVYSMNITGTLKGFLDHMSYKFHRPSYFEKKALVITTTAGAGHKETAKYVKSVLEYWGLNSIKTLAIAYRAENLTEKNIIKIKKSAQEFKKELENKQLKKATIKSVFMYNAWKAMGISQAKGSKDYEYWNNPKLKNTIYFKKIKVGILGTIAGKLGYKIMLKNMKKK